MTPALTRRRRHGLLAAVAAVAAVTTVGQASASAQPADPGTATPVPSSHHVALATAKLGALAHATGRQTVFVQLAGDGAAAVATETADATSGSASSKQAKARSAALNRRAKVHSTADGVVRAARGKDARAKQLYQVSNAVPGVALSVDAAALPSLAARPDVVKISAIVPKHFDNASAAQLTHVLAEWQSTGQLGKGVRVGVIDTGLDYTHKDFGGNGDYATAQQHASDAGYDWRAAQPALLRAKVAGGWDFVGDDYNADPDAGDAYQPVPHPDPNPLDCNEHGTHVAGTVAGYGENADGSTFTGDYRALTGDKLYAMKIGPGMAPAATLYSLKVFGCDGSTDVVIPALDWALDPNGDGNFNDHLDVVNLSLGSDYTPVDDPENDVVNELAKHGVLPVIAMGNNGDLTDTGGSPGNAVRSLAVASSVDEYQLRDGLRIDNPKGLVPNDIAAGQFSVAYDWANEAPVSGHVVAIPGANADGCDKLSAADAAKVAGKVAWLEWDDNDATRRCGSAGRSANVKAAGAIGAIFTSSLNVFGAGITGDPDIPVFQLPKTGTDALRPAVDAGTLDVTFDGTLAASIPDRTPSITDTLSGFSSRGTHGSIGVVKPDVTAPGDTIASAGMGSGDGVLVISGTSMATPHTAGIGALVRAQHPNWTVEQVKAAIMNTAGHDIYQHEGQTGQIYGPARVGAGRVDAQAAVRTSVLAYDLDTRGGVSASFGVVEAPIDRGVVRETRTVRVENTGSSSAWLHVSYQGVISQPGVRYTVSPSYLRVGAHRSANVRVTMTVVPSALRHTIDPTMDPLQLDAPRQYVSDASGRLLIAEAGKPTLRVPVYGAAKPVSTTHAVSSSHRGSTALRLTGRGVDQGSGSTAYTSLVSVLEFGAASPRLPRCAPGTTDPFACTLNESARGADLRYVGAGSAAGWLWFGINTYGENATIGNTMIPYVDFDTSGDGVPDYEVYVQNYPATDLLVAVLVDLNSGDTLDIEPANFQWGDVDTNVFDTDTLLLPVSLAAIGGVPAGARSFPITYRVGTNSVYGSSATGGDVDRVGPVRYDVLRPAVGVTSPLWQDEGGVSIPLAVSGKAKALVLHLHNRTGQRAEVVTVGSSGRRG